MSLTEIPEESTCPYCGTTFPLISDCMMHIHNDHPDKYIEWLNEVADKSEGVTPTKEYKVKMKFTVVDEVS